MAQVMEIGESQNENGSGTRLFYFILFFFFLKKEKERPTSIVGIDPDHLAALTLAVIRIKLLLNR